jgi:hypothetical protein
MVYERTQQQQRTDEQARREIPMRNSELFTNTTTLITLEVVRCSALQVHYYYIIFYHSNINFSITL